MFKALSTVVVALAAYICEHPNTVGKAGLELQLKRYRLLAWLAKYTYISASGVFELVHQAPPQSEIDEIARFAWVKDRDIELVAKVQTFLRQLKELQLTEVPVEGTEWYKEKYEAMRQSCPNFSKWHDLGFQGQNPATDFRGAGKLGVITFHNFCTRGQPGLLAAILSESHSGTEQAADQPWYPLALVSIRLTNSICEMLTSEKVVTVRLVQQQKNEEWLELIQKLHDKLLLEFHNAWLRAVETGEVKLYFDNEIVLKRFEQSLPLRAYKIDLL